MTAHTATETRGLTLTITGAWTDENYVPPRCRKPRSRQVPITRTFTIPEVSADDAPLAFRLPKTTLDDAPEAAHWREIRSHAGRLYRAYNENRHTGMRPLMRADIKWPHRDVDITPTHSYQRQGTSEGEWVKDREAELGQYLIIDGDVWVETTEPGYYVTTFGLGGNHGGTGMFVESGNAHGFYESYTQVQFRADEYEQAVAHAREVATNRGDTNDLARMGEGLRIVVLDPDQVRLVMPPRESRQVDDMRREYASALSNYAEAVRHGASTVGTGGYPSQETDEADAFAKIVAMRDRLLTDAPGGVTGHLALAAPYRPVITD